MKFRTFRIVATLGVLGVVGSGVFLLTRRGHHDDGIKQERVGSPHLTPPPAPYERPSAPTPTPSPAAAPAPAPTPIPTDVTPPANPDGSKQLMRSFDQSILDKARTVSPGAKLKDALKGAPQKVDIYGEPEQIRVKVDLDRNGKWDEKWSIRGAEVKREVAPADDEKYTEVYHLQGGAWVRK